MGNIFVYSPDGQRGTIPEENLEQALQMGFRQETPDEAAVRKHVEENKGIGGAAKVFLGQLADEALLGLPELVFDKTADPLEVAKKEALKKEHDLANTLGGIAGFGASMFAPGLNLAFKGASKVGDKVASHLAQKIIISSGEQIGKRTAKDIASKIVREGAVDAARFGTEGLAISAPHAVTEAVLGDPEQAAETLMAGGAMGALFGVATPFARELKRVAKSVTESQVLRDSATFSEKFKKEAAVKAAEALNPTLSQQERILDRKGMENVGRTLLDLEIITPFSTMEQVRDRLIQKSAEIGDKIGQSLREFDTLADDIAAATGEATNPFRIDPKQLANEIEHKVVGKYGDKVAYRKNLKQFTDELEALKAAPGTWSLTEANAQKAAFGDVISNWGLDQPVNKRFLQFIYDGINDVIEKKIDDLSKHELFKNVDLSGLDNIIGGDGSLDLLSQFKELKRKYGHLESAELIAKKSAAREAKNNDFSLTDFIMGSAGLAAGSNWFDDPTGAVLTGAAGLLGRNILRKHGNSMWAIAYNKTGLLLAEQRMKSVAHKLDHMEDVLRKMDSKNPTRTSTAVLGGAIRSNIYRELIGEDVDTSSTPQAKADRYQKFMDRVLDLETNPNTLTGRLAELSFPITEGGAPEIGAAFNLKLNQAFQYLAAGMPRPQNPPNPFAPKRKYVPNDSELSAFEQRLQIVVDPFSAISELEAGTLTRYHVEALKAVYPRLYETMRQRVFKAATEKPIELSYNNRVRLSLLLDVDLDQSLTSESIRRSQELYAMGPIDEGPGTTVPMDGPNDANLSNPYQTRMQRIRS